MRWTTWRAISAGPWSEEEARGAVAGIAAALCDMHRAAVTVAAEYERASGRTAAGTVAAELTFELS